MEYNIETLLIVLPFIFLAGFIDSIAGGGGLISLSGYMLAGVPVHMAMGTNKIQSSFGSAVATFNYVKSHQYRKEYVLFSIIGALLGSYLGTNLALGIDETILKIMLSFILPLVALLMIFKSPLKHHIKAHSLRMIRIQSLLIGLSIGMYDGLFGPGTGTMLIIAFSFCGLSLAQANGNAKIVNLSSGLISMIVFIINGKYILWLAIPSIIVNIIANYLGSKLAIKNGATIIRPAIFIVLFLLITKTFLDLI
ncbi:MAG: sulfite exporter TauE/SafE family protein [Bacilli bacterium]